MPEIFLFLIIAVLGLLYVWYNWMRIENEQSENVLQIARSIKTTLPKEDLKTLEAKAGDIDKPQYRGIKNILKEIIRINPKARFAYIYTERNGKIYFIADSEPEDSKDYSPPGQEYTEATSEDKQPFSDGKELITSNVTDRWGTWTSPLIPIKDEITGKTFAVFGMDFNSKSWDNILLFEVLESSVLTVLFLLAFLFLLRIKTKNKSLNKEITERKQAEDLLRESEEKYRLIFEYVPMGLFYFDENGIIVACNDIFVQIIGSSRGKLIGLDLLSLPDQKMISAVKNALTGSVGLYEGIYHSVTAKKSTPVRALFAPMDSGPGQVHGGVGIIEDITERKKAEEEIEESREKYRGLSEAAFEAIFISENGICIEQNQIAETLFGYTSEEAIGRYGTEWIVPEDREMVMNKILSGYEEPYESTALRKDGTKFPCVLHGKMMQYKGKTVRVTSLRDITERKLAETILSKNQERARRQRNAIARIMEDEIISFGDLTSSFQKLTEEVAAAIQVERVSIWLLSDDKTGLQCISLFENKTKTHTSGTILKYTDYPRYFEAINRESRINADDAQNDLRTSEFTEGYLVPIGINSMLDAGIYLEGDLKGVICLEHTGEKRSWYSDEESFASTMASIVAQTLAIMQRKQAEKVLKEAFVKAEAGNRLKTAFMNNISHEVRTPLNGILGFSNLILQPDVTQEEKEQYHTFITTSSRRLLSTVTNYMDISLIVSGNMEVKRKLIDLNQILNHLKDEFQAICISKNIGLHLQIPGNTENILFHSDETLFRKTLSHLIDNAIKFTIQGEITFGFKVLSGAFEFYVKDTGIGISREAISIIFESFVQEELSPSRTHDGSGLGLSIAQGFVRLLGGEMRVESEKSKGSTVFFTIPREEMKEEIMTLEPISSEAPVTGSTVMIAEDDESNLLLLKAFLKKLTGNVLLAKNGKEAVEQCYEHPEISLVLMDLKMPVMDGLEATRKIKSFRKDLPIIAITSYAMSGDEKIALEAGCSDYITKPFEQDVLLSKLIKFGLTVH